jgi:hypothetical protein
MTIAAGEFAIKPGHIWRSVQTIRGSLTTIR